MLNSSLINLKIITGIFSSNNEIDDLVTAISTSELKELELISSIRIGLKMGKLLARLLTESKTLEKFRLSVLMDCSVTRLLKAARTHSSVVMKPSFIWCREVVHVYSLGDRVTLFPQFKYYHYYKHVYYYYITLQ